MLNPVCLEYKEVGRDWVGPITSDSSGKLENARVREMIEVSQEDLSDEEKKKKLYYRRIKFEGKDSVVAFCGLVSDVTEQKGTFVWDEEGRVGVWEVRALNPVGREDIDSWARKVIRFREDGDESTKIEEFVEGYSVEKFRFLEGVTKRFTKDLHKLELDEEILGCFRRLVSLVYFSVAANKLVDLIIEVDLECVTLTVSQMSSGYGEIIF
ncbi:hypothetical protein AGABI2DRAFT_118544 [Agaricus bisporus var. bisporus H97]|uniref:hypothetical protein n=1 Tax=Agaricus bisporus var. bisporus (strain H97 / ATCC MYA-4626 / FGSC 10389) TaxID=936046 RepID=UPI00029F5302|nr:hypothetical protein AGABI2DRAFT_118544 [Agaricus bisporus var. bisporus H97]EKV46356.1 hypothetical protein AGABI2DRAFT_118544 [Agaricus bisporus var. bisporus H97]